MENYNEFSFSSGGVNLKTRYQTAGESFFESKPRNGKKKIKLDDDLKDGHRDDEKDCLGDDEFDNPPKRPQSSGFPSLSKLWCERCKKSFDNGKAWQQHLTNSRLHFVCRHCPDVVELDSEEALEKHYFRSHLRQCCETCHRHFINYSTKARHMEETHHPCAICGIFFDSDEEREDHYLTSDNHSNCICFICNLMFRNRSRFDYHNETFHLENYWEDFDDQPEDEFEDQPQDKGPPSKPVEQDPPNHYKTLGIDPTSTSEEVLYVAKKRRIETHPDRLKRQEGLSARQLTEIDEVAAEVGWAADILTDPVLRIKHDRELERWVATW